MPCEKYLEAASKCGGYVDGSTPGAGTVQCIGEKHRLELKTTPPFSWIQSNAFDTLLDHHNVRNCNLAFEINLSGVNAACAASGSRASV